jgi:hypothetical protein
VRIILANKPSTDVETPLLALPLYSDRLPTQGHTALCDWRLDGAIARLVLEGRTTGLLGQKAMIGGAARVGAERLLIYGLGQASGMSPVGLEKAVALIAADVAKLRLGSWSLGVMGKDLDGLPFRDAAASTLRAVFREASQEDDVRIVEEEPERFGLLVREVPKWLQAIARAYGLTCELVLEDKA